MLQRDGFHPTWRLIDSPVVCAQRIIQQAIKLSVRFFLFRGLLEELDANESLGVGMATKEFQFSQVYFYGIIF